MLDRVTDTKRSCNAKVCMHPARGDDIALAKAPHGAHST